MKHIGIYIILLAIVLASCKKESTGPGTYDNEILEQVNLHRTGLGLAPFESNDFMWQLANQHSTAMAEGTIPFGHDGATDRYATIRVEFGNGDYAENIDWGAESANAVVERWLESVGHKGNIEGHFTQTAISAVKSKDGKYYYTQLFYIKD